MPLQIIAEIGNNHGGDIYLAKKMSAAAIDAGADLIKFQIYDIENFIAPGNQYYDELKRETMTFDEFRILKEYVESLGAHFLATPFESKSLTFLNELKMSQIKISSGDFDNIDLIEQAIEYGMRLIISLGGSDNNQIDQTVEFLKRKNADFTLLHCVLSYPAKMADVNLSFIDTLKKRYKIPIGYSDHTEGIEASLGAIALGAEIIEKHFTTDRSLPGGDNEMSILPHEMNRLCTEGKNISKAIGMKDRIPSEAEFFIKKLVQRVYHAKSDIPNGDKLASQNIHLLRPKKPGVGFFAEKKIYLLNKRASRNIIAGEVITQNVII